MADQAQDALSQASQWLSGIWATAQDYLIAREERKYAEAMADQDSYMPTSAAGTWTNPNDPVSGVTSANKYQTIMMVLAFAGVVLSLLAFIRR